MSANPHARADAVRIVIGAITVALLYTAAMVFLLKSGALS